MADPEPQPAAAEPDIGLEGSPARNEYVEVDALAARVAVLEAAKA